MKPQSLTNSGLGENHPEVTAARQQLAEVQEILSQGVQAVKGSLQTRLQTAKQSLKNLADIEKSRAEDSTMDERKRYTQYMEAKRNYETQNLILTRMTESLLKEKVDLTMPRDPVTVHEVAEAWEEPARPNVHLNLLIGAAAGILLALPAGILLAYIGHGVSSNRA